MNVTVSSHRNDDLTVYMNRNYPEARTSKKYFWKKIEILQKSFKFDLKILFKNCRLPGYYIQSLRWIV